MVMLPTRSGRRGRFSISPPSEPDAIDPAKDMSRAVRTLPAICLMGALLVGCGGGGSKSPTPPTVDDFRGHREYCTPDEDGNCENWGLDAVGAAQAYARIGGKEGAFVAPGTGVTVGVVDTGIDLGHWEFDRDRVSETILEEGAGDALGDEFSHGTTVASLIVALRDGPDVPPTLEPFDFHGIAWGADLKMFAIILGSGGSTPYEPITLEELRESDGEPGAERCGESGLGYAKLLECALADDEGVDVLNMSFGFRGLIENYDAAGLADALADTIGVAAQSARSDADKTLLVWSAGNHNGDRCEEGTDNCVDGAIDATSPSVVNALPVHIEALRTHAVSVVATRRDGTLAGFSNRCGVAAKWCIAAPGEYIQGAYFGPSDFLSAVRGYTEPARTRGTSFAAPFVTGGLAVLMHYFRGQLGNTAVLARLYETAAVTPDDPADHGGRCPTHLDLDGDRSTCELSSTHGRGLMDLDAATRPVGSLDIALSDALSGARASAAPSLLRGGGAAGDALGAAFRGREMALFDELDAPFWVALDKFAQGPSEPSLGARLARFLEPELRVRERDDVRASVTPGVVGGVVEMPFASARLKVGVNRLGDGVWSGGHASLAPVGSGGASLTLDRGAFEVSTFAVAPSLTGDREERPAVGTSLSWRPRGSGFGLRLGALHEFESALGATASGAFGEFASGVAFAGIDFSTVVGGWRFAGVAELGISDAAASGGLVREVSPLSTSAFSLSAEREYERGGRLRVSLSQPLRVEGGGMRIEVPTGRTRRGGVLHEEVEASLSPSGRQVDLALDWRREVGVLRGEARLGAVLSLEPGHAQGRGAEWTVMAGYRLSF